MQIDRIDMSHLKMPLASHFETSFGRVYHQETLIIKVTGGDLVGWGECPASAQPYYSSETVTTAKYIIKDFLAPIILGKVYSDIGNLTSVFSYIRGHNMAKAGVIMALYDLIARKRKMPLAKLYGESAIGSSNRTLEGGIRKYIPSGISLGIQDSANELIKRVENALTQGYKRIKVKIKPGWDVNIIPAIRKRFPKILLAVDANGAYKLSDRKLLKKLDKYNLLMIEQPLFYNDIVDHAELQRELQTPICLDESIKSYHDAEQAIKLKSCRIINIKQARVGGPIEAIKIHDFCRKNKIPVWCGGLLESGIGRLHNIALASLPGFTLPPDISASARFYEKDIISPPIALQSDGTIKIPTNAGLGAEVNIKQLRQYIVHHETIKPRG
ncbi:MAG: o-succinylbenzoate synthase [Planctomycetes bacterium]|nr:o-succinylbenzoate synthase [Planctomycetota bacterium]